MKFLPQLRGPLLGIPLIVAVLALQPVVLAQQPATTPAPPQVHQEYHQLGERMSNFERRFGEYERHFAGLPAAERAELQAEFDALAERRAALRADVNRLEGIPRDQWTARFDPVHERLTDLEAQTLYFAHARGWVETPTAAERARIRTDMDARLQAMDRRVATLETRVRTAPEADRAALQRHLDQVRRDRQALRQDVAALERVPEPQWIDAHTRAEARLALLEARAHHFEHLAVTPRATVDVRVDPQTPTAAQMRMLRTDLDTRAQRIDAEIATIDQRVRALPAGEVRTDLEAQLTQLRQERDALRADIAALEGVTADEFYVRYRPVGERMARFETRYNRLALAAAPQRLQHVRVGEQILNTQRDRIAEMHRQLDTLPAADRAVVAYELIQLRDRYDEAWRLHQQMRFAPIARVDVLRDDFATASAQLQTDVQMAYVNMAVRGQMAVAGMPN